MIIFDGPKSNPRREELFNILQTLRAIELLKYNDKNLLANPKFISEQKEELYKRALTITMTYKLDPPDFPDEKQGPTKG